MVYPDNFENKIGFDRIRSQVKALCVTQGAVDKLFEAAFSDDYESVVARLGQVFEMRTVLMMDNGLPEGSFVDMDAFLKKGAVEGSFLEVGELAALRKGLAMVHGLVAFFNSRTDEQYPQLRTLCSGVDGFPEIINHIDSIVDKFGKVRDNASAELFSLRRTIRDRESQVSRRLQQIMGQAQASGIVDGDVSVSIREGRAVIPVAAANKKKIKGLIHDESATGKTVYIEPIEVVELNNELKALEYEERREVVRILTRFTDAIRPDLPRIRESGDFLTTMDFIRAKARFALANDCTLPIVENRSSIRLIRARHTLLAQTLRREGKEIVPLDLTLTDDKHILVISGPNAGCNLPSRSTCAVCGCPKRCRLRRILSTRRSCWVFPKSGFCTAKVPGPSKRRFAITCARSIWSKAPGTSTKNSAGPALRSSSWIYRLNFTGSGRRPGGRRGCFRFAVHSY